MGNASESFLAGGGPPSAKFGAIGDTVSGTIVSEPTVEQRKHIETGEPLTWKDGNPQLQMVVSLQTQLRDPSIEDDDGIRRLFVKGKLRGAVQESVIASGRKGLDVGGTLSVTYYADGEKTNPAFNAPKLFRAQYTPPSASEQAAQFLGTSADAPAAVPPAQLAAAPAAAVPGLPEGVTPEMLAALQRLNQTAA